MQRYIISTKGERLWQGIPTIERAPNGRLWCAFFTGGSQEPDPANTILLTASANNGATWSEPQPVIRPREGWRAYDPCLWLDPQGRLWLFYNRSAFGQGGYIEALICDDATSEQPAWQAPERIAVGAPFAFRLNKLTVLSNGDWVLPVTYMTETPTGWFGGPDQHLQGVALSSDRGKSWRLHGALQAPGWTLENMVIERRNGTLWMLIRTGAGVLWQSTSADGGHSWAPATPSEIVNPGVRFYIRRTPSGRLLLINTPNAHERTTLLAYLSDGGDDAPFGAGLMLDPRPNVSYPDAAFSPDCTIYAVHDCDRQVAGEILLDVFSEDELLAGSKA